MNIDNFIQHWAYLCESEEDKEYTNIHRPFRIINQEISEQVAACYILKAVGYQFANPNAKSLKHYNAHQRFTNYPLRDLNEGKLHIQMTINGQPLDQFVKNYNKSKGESEMVYYTILNEFTNFATLTMSADDDIRKYPQKQFANIINCYEQVLPQLKGKVGIKNYRYDINEIFIKPMTCKFKMPFIGYSVALGNDVSGEIIVKINETVSFYPHHRRHKTNDFSKPNLPNESEEM